MCVCVCVCVLKHVKQCPHIIYRSKHYSAFIQSGHKASFTFSLLKFGISVISVNKIHGKLWGDDNQLTHLDIYIDCSRNVSMKITEIQNFIFSLFYPIYIKFSLFCSIFLLLNLDRIFTLIIRMYTLRKKRFFGCPTGGTFKGSLNESLEPVRFFRIIFGHYTEPI